MARPPKDFHLRMDTDLRIPVTMEQKKTILLAIANEPEGFAAWARRTLLSAAEQMLIKQESHQQKPNSEQ